MQKYREFLETRLGAYFDLEHNYTLAKEEFNLFASFNQRNAKYMLMKKLEIYSFSNNEYILYKNLDRKFELDDLVWLKNFLDSNIKEIVNTNTEHMSSLVTFIFTCDEPDSIVEEKIKKFKYYKSFFLGLNGWVNVKIILINSVSKYGISNKLAKEDIKKFIM